MAKSVSPIGRVSYPYVFEPQTNDNGTKSYSVVLMFDKTADLSEMKAAAAKAEKEFLKGKKTPPGWKNPFRDGDEKNHEGKHPEYAGKVYISFRANENRKPQVVDAMRESIGQQDFYAGCFARVSYDCYAFDKNGNRGVAFSLGNIQKVRDGEPLDGRTKAEDDFDAVDQSASLF